MGYKLAKKWVLKKAYSNGISDRDAPYFGSEIPNAPASFSSVWV